MGTEDKYAIIGAGPSGLCGAKNLKEMGIPFDGYEAASDLGGLWNIKNENSTVYESAHLISSKGMTEFEDFPMKDDVADYPHHSELYQYFSDYADHFGLREHYQFNMAVKKIEEVNGKWKLTTEAGISNLYKGIIIANGCLTHPNIPNIPGNFEGELLHSKDYKDPSIFEGKKVLIIGAGNSGCDIVVDAVHRAQKVDMSVRRGYHFVPKYIFGKPADTIGGFIQLPRLLKQRIDKWLLNTFFVVNPQRLGFPEPDHKLYESHPIVNTLVLYHLGHGDLRVKKDVVKFEGKTVHFKDGTQEEYDMVLCATGYQLHYPFIDKNHLNWGEEKAPQLYLNIFTPHHNNIFVLGMVEATGLGWEGRNKQAILVARFISEMEKGSHKAQQFFQKIQSGMPDMRGGFEYMDVERMAYYVHKDTYLKQIKRHLKMLS